MNDFTKNNIANKLPALTLGFWIMKIAATTLGETGGDWVSMTMNVGYLASTLIFFGLFVVSLGSQLVTKRYIPFLYWTVIVATSTAGTTLSDYMDRTLELGYAKGSAILITALFITLFSWKFSTGSLSVSEIKTKKGEFFYWIAILFSNTLGTAMGDFLADDSGLGFLGSWLCISTVLVLIVAAYRFTKISRVFLFWFAFILTRPFGATFGDLLTKEHEKGGFNLGTGYSSLILFFILVTSIFLFNRNSNARALQEV